MFTPGKDMKRNTSFWDLFQFDFDKVKIYYLKLPIPLKQLE